LYKLDIATGQGDAADVPDGMISGMTALKLGSTIELLLPLNTGKILEKQGDPIPKTNTLGRTSWRVLK
jgi:hypothetical protein